MPRIIIARAHPPTSIEDLPKGGERTEVLLLPGLPKKVSEVELAHIVKNYPALTIQVLQRNGKPKAKAKGSKSKIGKPEESKAAKSEDDKSADIEEGSRSKKKSKKSRH